MGEVPDKPHAQALIERLEASCKPTSRRTADDGPVTEEDRRRIEQGRGWFARRGGQGIPMEDVLAEFGLNPEDLPH